MSSVPEGVVDVGGGRRVGYARHGLESGVSLLEFHGVPGSRAYDLDAEAPEADVDSPAAVGDGSAGQISEDGQPVA